MAEEITVTSLAKFSYNKQKKFSFKKNNSKNGNGDGDNTSDEDYEAQFQKNKSAPHQPKGSAMLKKKKNSDSDASFSSEDSEESNYSSKKKSGKKSSKTNAPKNISRHDEKKLEKLFEMFPEAEVDVIEDLWFKHEGNAKKCVDALVKRETNGDDDGPLIEEWSDGDEEIRQQNVEEKKKRKAALNSKCLNTLDSSRKKIRKIESESDEDQNVYEDQNSNSTRATANFSNESSGDDQKENSAMKKKKKKRAVIVNSSSDDNNDNDENNENEKKSKSTALVGSSGDENNENETKHHKKSKKHKHHKKSSKKTRSKHRRNDSDNEGIDDTDFSKQRKDQNSSDSDEDVIPLTDKQKADVLNVFNTFSADDMHSTINISKPKVKNILELRPFKTFFDCKKRLQTVKNTDGLFETVVRVLDSRKIVDDLFLECETISANMVAKVATLIGDENDDGDDNNENHESTKRKPKLEIASQPKSLNSALQLKPYQLIGLNWLCLMHKENLNGILADEMGLGKTCQTISFLAHLQEKYPKQTHLICVPPSTLDNWVREINVWCPDINFTVYQGSMPERKMQRMDILNDRFEKHLNVILTTYTLLFSTPEDKAFFRKKRFEYVIYDEAHMLKNMKSSRYQNLIKINSKRKLLLTGTPFQNDLTELMALLYFVMPDLLYNKNDHLNKIFNTRNVNTEVDTFYDDKIKQAKGIMKPFILRRVKDQVLKQLPKKTISVMRCPMARRQGREYTKTVEYFKAKREELLAEIEEKNRLEEKLKASMKMKKGKKTNDTVVEDISEIVGSTSSALLARTDKKVDQLKNTSTTSNIVMELRKMSNHPLLCRCLYDAEKIREMATLVTRDSPPDTRLDYVIEDMTIMSDFEIYKLCDLYPCLKPYKKIVSEEEIMSSGKLIKLLELLEEKKKSGDRVLLFSQFVIMLNIVEEFLKQKGFKFLRLDGSTPIGERQTMIDEYNENDEILIFIISTKSGGTGINLTAANTVVMYDIDYNPFNDKQAEDRCHRVGQKREVSVFKFVSENTIDELMLKIQERKLTLGEDMTSEKAETSKKDMESLLKQTLNM